MVARARRVFLYYGLKAVQLTEMSNRVWKRTAEYNLILGDDAGGGQRPRRLARAALEALRGTQPVLLRSS